MIVGWSRGENISEYFFHGGGVFLQIKNSEQRSLHKSWSKFLTSAPQLLAATKISTTLLKSY
jgi:hypothetical protein